MHKGELLLELLSEEIPARMQRRAIADLAALITDDHVGRFWKWAGQETEPDFLTDKPYIRATQVCLRTQGRWQVVHAHFSSGRTGKRPDQGGPE